jgi:IS30 family transposase
MEDSPEPLDGLRRRIVMQLTREGKSQREIGSSLGVDQKTISNDVRYEENSSKPSLSSEDKLAKNEENSSKPATNDKPPNSNMVNRLQSLSGEVEWYTPGFVPEKMANNR